MVLTAGLGTRLRPLTEVRAKAAIPVAKVPLIRRILPWLAAAGVTDVVVNLHHQPETITRVLGDGGDFNLRVRYTWEHPVVLGSAGGPRLALPLLGSDDFFLINGDTLTDVDLSVVAGAHVASGALVTMALSPEYDAARYGGVLLDNEGVVTGFGRQDTANSRATHFFGVQVVRPEAFAALTPGQPIESIGSVYNDWMARRPGSVRGLLVTSTVYDVGTITDYWRTCRAFIARDPDPGAWAGHNVRIDPSARVRESIVWDDVDVGAGASLNECIVTDGVRVPSNSTFSRSVLLAGADGQVLATPFTT